MMQPLPSSLALAVAISVCATLAADVVAQRPERERDEARVPTLRHVTFATRSFESKALGTDLAYGVYLPASYDAEDRRDTRYPLVIWLHGMWEDHERFHTRGGGQVLDDLTGSGDVPEMVFVCANGGRASFYMNGVVERSAYEDAIRNDLIAHVDATYRVSRERGQRAIAGVSMGGYGALKIAFRDPHAFGVVAAHSAALLVEDPDRLEDEFTWLRGGRGKQFLTALFGDPVDAKKWTDENVLTIARTLEAEPLGGLAIYFDCGDEDRYQFDGPNQRLHETLESRSIPHRFRLVKGGGHGWQSGYNQAAVPYSLRFIAERFTEAHAAGEPAAPPKAPRDGKTADTGHDGPRR